jgi:hypothetical protein
MNKIDLSWLGAIIDGEGSISCGVTRINVSPARGPNVGDVRLVPFVCIVNSDEGILSEVERIITETNYKFSKWAGRKKVEVPGRKKFTREKQIRNAKQRKETVCFNIRILGLDPVYGLLKIIRPYLRSTQKKRNADVMMKYISSRKENGIQRNHLGHILRAKYSRKEIKLISSIRVHKSGHTYDEICQAGNVH